MSFVGRLLAAIGSVCILWTGAALAQSSSGTITGRVLDTSGNSVPGATVRLIKQDTREVRTFQTQANGEFVFASLQPGPYGLTVEAQGFKAFEKQISSSLRPSA